MGSKPGTTDGKAGRNNGKTDNSGEPLPERLRQKPSGPIARRLIAAAAGVPSQGDGERNRGKSNIEQRGDRVDAAVRQRLDVGAEVIRVKQRLGQSPNGKADQPDRDQREQHGAERCRQQRSQSVRAAYGALRLERGQQQEGAQDEKDDAAGGVADPRHRLEQGGAPHVACCTPRVSRFSLKTTASAPRPPPADCGNY